LFAPELTLRSASAPAVTQRLLLYALAAGAILLFPSLWLLFQIFRRGPRGARGA
jgi:cytochrome d ubiquinol oxidase subunit II